MTNLDELEDLLRRGKKEKAYEQIKEDRGTSADILINEGFLFGTIGEYSISISYFELAEKISKNNEIKKIARENLAVAYLSRGNAHSKLKQRDKAIEDYNKAIELNPKYALAYTNRGTAYLQTNEDLDKAIEDFRCAKDLFEGKEKERMLGFMEWARARKEMNIKRWDDFRERMKEAREIFEKINNPLSYSLDAFIKFSFIDEELDNALKISDPMEALKKIETALKNLPEVEGLIIGPEGTIFGARVFLL
jgi:tetratricopeptide (TPR) repeat protein